MSFTYLEVPGQFECRVVPPVNGWIGEAGQNNSPFIRIPVEVLAGPEKGKCAVWRGWLTTKAFQATIQRLVKVFGFDGNLANLELGKTTFVGLPCNIQTATEEYEGKTKLVVKWLNPPGGGDVKKLAPEKLSKILDSLNTKAMAVAQATSKAEPTAEAAPEDDAGGDPEVPF